MGNCALSNYGQEYLDAIVSTMFSNVRCVLDGTPVVEDCHLHTTLGSASFVRSIKPPYHRTWVLVPNLATQARTPAKRSKSSRRKSSYHNKRSVTNHHD
jgi:hypothetical protein